MSAPEHSTATVIQYHFGSREALMLAVLADGTERLNETLVTAEITGGTVTERVAQYADISRAVLRFPGVPGLYASADQPRV